MVGSAASECVMEGSATRFGGREALEEPEEIDLSDGTIEDEECVRWYCIGRRPFFSREVTWIGTRLKSCRPKRRYLAIWDDEDLAGRILPKT